MRHHPKLAALLGSVLVIGLMATQVAVAGGVG